MPELEDVRGRSFSWLQRTTKPLEIRLYGDSAVVGSVRRASRRHPYEIEFAGLVWVVERLRAFWRLQERIGFAGSEPTVAQNVSIRDSGLWSIHTLTADDGWVYRLGQKHPHRAAWRDETGAEPADFRVLGSSASAGEVEVLKGAVLTDAPILLIVGVIRAVEGRVFAMVGY